MSEDVLSNGRPLLDPAALMQLGGIKLRARRVVEGVLAGLHRSPHKGASVEFAEYKEYAPGDDIRHIDWKAYAKSDKVYVKLFEEETNLRAYMLLDTSGSMGFGSHGITKLEYGKTLAASLAHLLLRQGDAAGLMLFDSAPGQYAPPASRATQLDDVLSLLDAVTPGARATNVAGALSSVAERVRRRSLVVLISDMLDTNEATGRMLGVLHARKMDVALLHLIDPDELTLPYEGLTLFEGMENDGHLLVEPDDIRESYVAALEEHLFGIKRTCQQSHIDYYRVVTTTPFEEVLLDLLQRRKQRRAGRPTRR